MELETTLPLAETEGGGEYKRVWSPYNQGPGSGLDADTLDGIDSTGFAKTASDNNLIAHGNEFNFMLNSSSTSNIIFNYRGINDGNGCEGYYFAKGLNTTLQNQLADVYVNNLYGAASELNLEYDSTTQTTTEDNAIPANARAKIYMVSSSSANGDDGYIIGLSWRGGNFKTQIYIDVDPTYSMAIRYWTLSNQWTAWKQILTEDSLTPQMIASTLEQWGITINSSGQIHAEGGFYED